MKTVDKTKCKRQRKKKIEDQYLYDLRVAVKDCCHQLAQGFLAHPKNKKLRQEIENDAEAIDLFFCNIRMLVLRLVYLRVSSVDFQNFSITEIIESVCDQNTFGKSNLKITEFLLALQIDEKDFESILAPIIQLTHPEKTNGFQSEYFGNIHESLLGFRPVFDGETYAFDLVSSKGNARKTSGSYYTPSSLVTLLCDLAIEPKLNLSSKPMKVCDPACGGGYFLLEAGRRIVQSHLKNPKFQSIEKIEKDVFQNCIFGADLDPLAAEMTRMAICFEIGDGKINPRDFQNNIRTGNSLLDDSVFAKPKGTAGIFDVMIGNPPWDKVEIEEREWFAIRCPEIANAGTAAKRRTLIKRLESTSPSLFEDFQKYKNKIEELSKEYRDPKRFPNTGAGRNINVYALFVEKCSRLINENGTVSLLTPLGIATEDTSKKLISELIDKKKLRSIFGFKNQSFFQGVASGVRFCAITFDQKPINDKIQFAFDLLSTKQIHKTENTYELQAEEIHLLNPLSHTVPIFNQSKSVKLLKTIYENAPAWCEHQHESGWPGKPKQQYNISDYGEYLVSSDDVSDIHRQSKLNGDGEELIPVLESKYFSQYNHRHASHDNGASLVDEQKLYNQHFDIRTRYMMKNKDHTRQNPLGGWIVYRVITSISSSPRTCIASVVPPYPCSNSCTTVVGCSRKEQVALLAIMNSFAFDFAVRCKLPGNNLNVWIWKQLPFPTQDRVNQKVFEGKSFLDWVYPRVAELSYTSHALDQFFPEIAKPFAWNSERRIKIRAEIDAAVFHLFRLTKKQSEQVLNDFSSQAEREVKEFGSFMSKDLILNYYMRLDLDKHPSSLDQNVTQISRVL